MGIPPQESCCDTADKLHGNTIDEGSKVLVYHGTTSLFDDIEVSKGKPYKDFGKGFYVTRTYSHAESLAR